MFFLQAMNGIMGIKLNQLLYVAYLLDVVLHGVPAYVFLTNTVQQKCLCKQAQDSDTRGGDAGVGVDPEQVRRRTRKVPNPHAANAHAPRPPLPTATDQRSRRMNDTSRFYFLRYGRRRSVPATIHTSVLTDSFKKLFKKNS
jgi:hypothetical protein